MITRIGNFLIDQWLWQITWDWYHALVLLLCMTLLFRFVLRINSIAAVLLSLSSIVATIATYTMFVVGILMYVLRFSYHELVIDQAMVADPLQACIYLGIVYTVLQTLYFAILNRYYRIPWQRMAIITVLCNALASAITYLMLPSPLL